MKNIFYHYCPKHLVYGIKRGGLTLGRTPYADDSVISGVSFALHTQWITKDKNPINQKWAESKQRLGYDRNEAQIKINIPNNYMDNVLSMAQVCEGLGDSMLIGFNDFPEETKDWFCFAGNIPVQWIERIRVIK